MPNLSPRLAEPARLIYQAATQARVTTILIGGWAAQAKRVDGADCHTKDLDIDMKSLKFLTKFDSAKFYTGTRVGSSTGCLTTTFILNPNDHTKRDIAGNPNIEVLLPFTKLNHDGIRYSSPALLLACKIRTYGERAMGNGEN